MHNNNYTFRKDVLITPTCNGHLCSITTYEVIHFKMGTLGFSSGRGSWQPELTDTEVFPDTCGKVSSVLPLTQLGCSMQ